MSRRLRLSLAISVSGYGVGYALASEQLLLLPELFVFRGGAQLATPGPLVLCWGAAVACRITSCRWRPPGGGASS